MTFVGARGVSALGSDGNNDAAPSNAEDVAFPIHVLAIAVMGIHLLDYLEFEGLRTQCERAARGEFLFVTAPLRILGGTGSSLDRGRIGQRTELDYSRVEADGSLREARIAPSA